ncbi:hypothetical protein P7C73_g2865, partial [Tremellales sp. Uapishka_1]
MSSSAELDVAAKRKAALEALRSKARARPVHGGARDSPEAVSPESHVLVPPSSSPQTPSNASSTSKYFNNMTLPSSNLASVMGSPTSVINVIRQRHNPVPTPQFHPTPPAASASFSYEDSPGTPQPLSRLKPKYVERSPTQASSSSGAVSRTPSLIYAAQQQYNQQEERLIGRLITQYRHVQRKLIVEAVRRAKGDEEGAIREVAWISKQDFALPVYHPPPTPAQPPPLLPPLKRGKKNEKSTLYKKRNGNRKRDPDESTEEEGMSEDGSEQSWSGDDGHKRKKRRSHDEVDAEGAALRAFNEDTAEVITGTIACSADQAAIIIKLRPYHDADDLRSKLTKARGVSAKLFEQYTEIMEGYVQIDSCLNRCEEIGNDVSAIQRIWRGAGEVDLENSVVGTPRSDGLNDVKVDVKKVSELLRVETDARRKKVLQRYIQQQPRLLSKGTVLKDYQLLGVNWLNLLYNKKIGCILADEMGLGKTIQVIAFLAHLKENKIKGPHMIFVPASTLENWTREFEKFAPDIDVLCYFGSQAERGSLRDDIKRLFRAGKLEVVLASYTQVASNDDLSFFRKKIVFETCIYDEGHSLKNFQTKRYTDLLSIKPKWRLLLTGTPLQNNLQELVSLLMFIHKDVFTDAEQYLRAIFKVQASSQISLLSQQRVSRARTMLTPFVLRRRKANVLDLPPKIETVRKCDMTTAQSKLYRDTLRRSRKVLEALPDEAIDLDDDKPAKPAKGKKKEAPKAASSSNIIMDLRKAASHPLLFRRLYTDAKVKTISKQCLQMEKFCDSNFDFVVEDFSVMSDAEIHHFVTDPDHEELMKFGLDESAFMEGGKVKALRDLLDRCKRENKRMLLFSQFTMILDILQVVLDYLNVKWIRLDGGTRTDERQTLVDEFNEDEEITVFLLSTKAGGVGINLTAASVVVIYDQDFNPHNDRQAADRAYRIGQEKEVEVIKLITTDSIDEDMLNIGLTKLQLDDAVGGEETSLGDDGGDDKTAKEAKKSLLSTLRNKFEATGDVEVKDEEEKEEKADAMPESAKKVARGARYE